MLSDLDVRNNLKKGLRVRSNGNLEDSSIIGNEVERMLRERNGKDMIINRERDLNILRSGSAPPTIDGSLTAIGSLYSKNLDVYPSILQRNVSSSTRSLPLSEDQIRSHPAYLQYYYAHDNINPRLPPPLLSKEDWRVAQRVQAAGTSSYGGNLNKRKEELMINGNSLFSSQPGRPAENGDARNLTQQDQPSAEWLERDTDGLIGLAGVGLGAKRKSLADMLQEGLCRPTPVSNHLSLPVSRYGSDEFVGSSMSRSTTPDAFRVNSSHGSNASNGISPIIDDHAILSDKFSGLSLSKSRLVDEDTHMQSQFEKEFDSQPNGNLHTSKMSFDGQSNFANGTSSANLYKKGPYSGPRSLDGSNGHLHHEGMDMPEMGFSGYMSGAYNHGLNSVINHLDEGVTLTGSIGQSLHRNGNQMLSGPQVPLMDPLYVQCLQRASDCAAHATRSLSDSSLRGNYLGTSHGDMIALQKAYLAALIQQQRPYSVPHLGNGMGNSAFPLAVSGSPILQNERIPCFPYMVRSPAGGTLGTWLSGNGRNMEEIYGSSLLEDFKTNKTRNFELSEIVDHVVEFSVDQYGSRFIQQKLESATVHEKNTIFPEIIPHARNLMTDVFGNYVIQKFFEHGTESQRKELANELMDHVLPLSLQMYGCRVIQKALEVVDVDQQTQMVAELDGSIMKCVRDQNGNHVIQKCIECVPQDRIQFIISAFYGQVVPLSTHPYGCRVIQRVLEYCNDAKTQHIILEEIMQFVCSLAQDQYGNYVVQHVLQYGKPHERTAIINKLVGQIVSMSQQKFASNVVEKCLTFGSPEERQILVNEMLGSSDENEPLQYEKLQAMMKDQFGNYVVQKVLETCDNHTRELILSRVKAHLNTLKRYTYGKHIVARVEKLLTTGERQIASSYFS